MWDKESRSVSWISESKQVLAHIFTTQNKLKIASIVTKGHLAQIHSSTVGDFSLIGMGSILQAGSRVEPESFIAAGAVVRPGVVIPSGELWAGNPARKLRDLSDKERAKLHYQSSEYVQVAMGHRDVMELGGNLFEGNLPIEAGDDVTLEPQEEELASVTASRA